MIDLHFCCLLAAMYNSSNKYVKNKQCCVFDLELKEERFPILSEKGIPSQIDESHSPYLHSTDTLAVITRFRGGNFQVSRESCSMSYSWWNIVIFSCLHILFCSRYSYLHYTQKITVIWTMQTNIASQLQSSCLI